MRHRVGRGEARTGVARTGRPARTKQDWARILEGVRGTITYQASLQDYTSFRIGGPADALVEPVDVEDLCRVVAQARAERIPVFVVGGTNVLVRDGGIRGIVVSLRQLKTIRQEPGHVLYADGGVGMPTLIGYAIRRSLSGLEWGAGIPGTVAGCVVMNAGTRLGEMKDSVKAVRMVDPRGRVVDIPAADIPFSYRKAHLPRGIVAGVWLQLRPGAHDQIERTVKDYLQYRKDTQPLTWPSAGCVFKNPPQDSAGRLVDAAGLKGARIGDAQVSDKHANFMVNLGQARAADVLALIRKVRAAVKKQSGVTLELELKVVGQA
ncbi:MAG TPA: UDP-N-acetylenolpyruvoylglucosamine reductase [Nitrospira sp.]|nr:UDP-N-acetylenolpyruvoylglucosamine reductase [Nitrospira sp.]